MNLNYDKTATSHSRRELIAKAFEDSKRRQGYVLEFGVGQGHSLNMLSNLTERIVFGFDSFQGLPENWAISPHVIFAAGSFQYDPPETKSNVELLTGWFKDTIPGWKQQNSGPIAFLHIDSDLYSSCKTILTELNDRIIPGTVILFDEMFGYRHWEEGEWKATQEWLEQFDREIYELGTNHTQAAYRVIV